MPHCKKSKTSHQSKKCHKHCFCLCVPFVPNPSYSVDILRLNPLNPYRKCKCCKKPKQHPVTSSVVMTPIPMSAF